MMTREFGTVPRSEVRLKARLKLFLVQRAEYRVREHRKAKAADPARGYRSIIPVPVAYTIDGLTNFSV